MSLSSSAIRRILFPLLAVVLLPAWSFGQYPQPSSLGISPTFLYRPGGYTLCAGNGAYMTLDIYYAFSGGGGGPIYGWPSLDGSGCTGVDVNELTPLGTYYFVAAKNTLNADWVGMSAQVTIDVPPPPAPDFSISMSPAGRTVDQGQSTSFAISFSAVNGFDAYLSLSVTTPLPAGVSASFSPNPAPPGSGAALTITASPAAVGAFDFTVQATGIGITRSSAGTVTVRPRQPASMTFSPATGYAGNGTCYTLAIGNAANMTVDIRYRLNFVSQPETSVVMDANGQWQYCPDHYAAFGEYDFTEIKNHLRADWVTLSPLVTYYLWPPKPTSLSISPSSVTAGTGTYRMTVGNGALVTLDTRFNINGGPTISVTHWPSLVAVAPGSPNGQADISPGPCVYTGLYNYTQIENSANGIWVPVSASELIESPGPASVTSVAPSAGIRGTNVDVTITGANLCGSVAFALATTWPGLTFSGVHADQSAVQATFNISPTASIGTATVTLNGGGGSASFAFTVLPPVGLTREYIYLGTRVIATETP